MKISRYTVTTTQYSMAFYCACVDGNGMIVLLYISYSVFNYLTGWKVDAVVYVKFISYL